jgi:hypothetical protein
MTQQQQQQRHFASVAVFNEDTNRWSKLRIPVANPGDRPSPEATNEQLRKRGLAMMDEIKVLDRPVDFICMVETAEESVQRKKRQKKMRLERQLEINMRW